MSEATTTITPEDKAMDEKMSQIEAEQDSQLAALEQGKSPADTTLGGDRAPSGDKGAAPDPDSKKPSDTPSEADKQEVETAKAEAEKEGKELDVDDKGAPKRGADGKFVKRDKAQAAAPAIALTPDERKKFDAYLAERQGSKYAKDFTRRLVTWSELNAEKDALAKARDTETAKLKSAVDKFNADVLAFRTEQAQTKPTPEKYDSFAAKCEGEAKIKLAEAITAENEGRIEDAEKLRDEAKFLNRDAAAAKASAEHVRKNPPPTLEAQKQKFLSDQRTWIDKAAVDFPEFAKQGSAIQQATAEYFKQMTASEPAVAKLPGFIYFCAERAALKAAADGVSAKDKELGELRTKVKDLEALTNPTPQGGINIPMPGARKSSLDTQADLDREADELKAMLRR